MGNTLLRSVGEGWVCTGLEKPEGGRKQLLLTTGRGWLCAATSAVRYGVVD